MMKVLAIFLHMIDTINEWSGKIVSFLIGILVIIIVYDVALRYVFSRPTIWAMDSSTILLATVSFVGAGYSLLHGAHVKVDIFFGKFPMRVKAAINVFTYFFIFITCIVLIKYGGKEACESLVEGTRDISAWGPPLWISQIMVPIGALLIGVQALASWIRDLVTATTGVDRLRSKVFSGEGGMFQKKEDS